MYVPKVMKKLWSVKIHRAQTRAVASMNHESKHVIAVLILEERFMETSEMIITLIKSGLMFEMLTMILE